MQWRRLFRGRSKKFPRGRVALEGEWGGGSDMYGGLKMPAGEENDTHTHTYTHTHTPTELAQDGLVRA